jgi:hypothetical protein
LRSDILVNHMGILEPKPFKDILTAARRPPGRTYAYGSLRSRPISAGSAAASTITARSFLVAAPLLWPGPGRA